MRPQQIHWLSGNKVQRSPRRLVFLDTESTWEHDGQRETHRLRLWVARLVIRDGTPRTTVEDAWHTGRTGPELAERLRRWARTDATLWVYAHNLTFDLCTTRVITHLLHDGWELGDHALANDSPWARLRRGRYRMTLADSASWLPRSIEHLGAMVRIPKPDLPDQDDSDAAWVDRCRGDVDILSTAMTELLDWWDRRELGCWSLTGTSTGWNAYRHRPADARVVIDPDPAPRRMERQAIVAGRRDAWRIGPQPTGRTILIDLERAHLTAAREFDLPRRRGRDRGPEAIDDWPERNHLWSPLLDCTVRTATPRYPWRHCDRIWYPIGSFRTILAGPEVVEAIRRNELQRVHSGRLYLLGPTMRRWATWLTGVLDGTEDDAPITARLWAKMCSQRVCGKWAARTTRAMEPWMSDRNGWSLELGYAIPAEARLHILHLDGTAYPMVQDQEANEAFPAVLAWIQSHVRVALGRLLDQLDPARIISCNTDGVLYRAPADPDMAALARATHPFIPRIKAVHHDVDVLGAAHLVLDGHLKLSGVPSSASPTGETSLAWETWPRMRRQLQVGAPDGYVREHREVDLANVPVPRWVLADMTTRPVMTTVDSLGTTRILPFVPGVTGTNLPALAQHQHPVLTQLLTEHRSQSASSILG